LQDDALQQLLSDARGSLFFCDLCCLAGGYELVENKVEPGKAARAQQESMSLAEFANRRSEPRSAVSDELAMGRRWLDAALALVAGTIRKHTRLCHR